MVRAWLLRPGNRDKQRQYNKKGDKDRLERLKDPKRKLQKAKYDAERYERKMRNRRRRNTNEDQEPGPSSQPS